MPNDVSLSLSHVSGGQQSDWVNNVVMCLCFNSDMKKTGCVCYPCWKENGREKPYSRSYDLIAHMVNVHEKYPNGTVNKAAYSTDGSNVRDAMEEEKVRYRDANKHRRKKVDEKSSSSKPSASNTVLLTGEPTPARPASARAERSTGDATSGNKSGGNRVKEVERDRLRNRGEFDEAQKSDNRGVRGPKKAVNWH